MTRLAPAALLALVPALPRAADTMPVDLENILVPLGAIGSTFGFVAVIVAVVAYARHRNQRLRHETIRLALEKGQPLPADLLDPVDHQDRDPGLRDLRRGLVLLAVGVGTCLYLGFSPYSGAHHQWAAGLIPGLMGLAYIGAWAVARRRTANARPEQG
ncbi:MAG TPA: DUF6249 domain-containing protein [Anaeromyxobacter sp.]|nr:DUF6249 domain-containing protein [Anaeromyxobacter sp.]